MIRDLVALPLALVSGVLLIQPAYAAFDPAKPFQIRLVAKPTDCAVANRHAAGVAIKACDKVPAASTRWTWSKDTRQLRNAGADRCAAITRRPADTQAVALVPCATEAAPAQQWDHDAKRHVIGGATGRCWVVAGAGVPSVPSAVYAWCDGRHHNEFQIVP